MKRRRSPRIPVYIETDLYSGGNSYAGFIGNLSESGIFVETIPTQSGADFVPGTRLVVEFQHPSGAPLNLDCRIAWLRRKISQPEGLTNMIGLTIVQAPLQYTHFVKNLCSLPLPFNRHN